MSYFERTKIQSADSPSIDAFGKWRVSNPTKIFDSKQVIDGGSYYYDTLTVAGGSIVWNSGSASSTLSVTTTSGSRSIKQTKEIFVYQPGNSQQILLTGVFGTGVNGIVKRIGYFDDDDGFLFSQSGSSFGCVLRKKIDGVFTDTFYSQSAWNLDKLNGSGPSGNILDVTKAQIYTVDFEWLGVGRVRYGIIQKGVIIYVHEITNYNNLTDVYIRNPNLPVRYEITNYKGSVVATSLKSICASVISEGGYSDRGIRRVVTANLPVAISSNQYAGILAIRYNAVNSQCGKIIPDSLSFLISPGNNAKFSGRWELLANPTTSGFNNWRASSGSVVTQVSTVPSGSNITQNGTILATGYFSGAGGSDVTTDISLDPFYSLGKKIDNTSDTLVLAIKTLDNTYSVYPTLVIRELS